MVAQLGPYLIDETLAEGGMARVFRARLRGPGGFEKTLVLKQIRPELARDPRFVEMFVREANTLVQMSHPHIVPVYELGAVDGSYYLSMEFIDGATVSRLLEDGPLGPTLVAQIGVQLCDALDYAHGRFGILHRDITPRNLIVDDAGHVRLLDFGIAAALDAGGAERFGSPGYMSPEQVRGETLTPASDLFSLGAVLCEALTGQPPFEKTVRGSLRPAAKLIARAELPRALTSLVDALLEPEPGRRPQSALDTGRRLREWLAQAQPEGAFAELRERARSARAKVLAAGEAKGAAEATRERSGGHATQPMGAVPDRAVQTFATSPVLTEMLRSATGVGRPLPLPPGGQADEGPATRRIEPDTRPIEPDTRAEEPPAQPRATALMLRWWPALALLAFAVAGVVMLGAPHTTRDAQRQPKAPVSARAPTPAAPVPAVTPEPAPPDAPSAKAAIEADAAQPSDARLSDTAWLTLNATPWAEVSLDGRSLGTTPLRRLKVRSGSHVLRFDCPPLGKSSRVNLTINRDAEARVMVDLSRDPPRTTLEGASATR